MAPPVGLVIAQDPVDRYKLLFRLQVLVGIGCVLIFLYSICLCRPGEVFRNPEVFRIAGVGLLVAGAALLSGFLSGFIFAVPRVGSEHVSPPVAPDPGGAQLAPSEARANAVTPNSNLVEISDWLTKILVGVGLVELNSIPRKLGTLSYYLGEGLLPAECDSPAAHSACLSSGRAAGLAIIIFYFTLGFMLGYIWTRLYFQRDLNSLVENLQRAAEISQQEKKNLKFVTDSVFDAERLIDLGKLSEAMTLIDEALKVDPAEGRAVLTKGRILKRQALQSGLPVEEKRKLLNEALALANQAIPLLPGSSQPLYNKACYEALLGFEQGEVLESLKRAFNIDPALRALASSDDDLVSLREVPAFRKILEEDS
jgi:tetratricopeptide (TPR) repeat protein